MDSRLRSLLLASFLVFVCVYLANRPEGPLLPLSLSVLIKSLFISLVLFLPHELSHYLVARRIAGLKAGFLIVDWATLLSLILCYFRVNFILVGGVVVDHASKRDMGKIALAGPLANYAFGIGVLLVSMVLPTPYTRTMLFYSFWYGLFNLLPFPPLDGFKVFIWSKKDWFFGFMTGVLGLLALSFI